MTSDAQPESFPDVLRTGSMLDRAVELTDDVPAELGPYRILEKIGTGGMGVVYLAEQAPPLVRRVAVKLARSAVPDGRVLARFESERRTLAVMNHPNVARVFDAGTASDGRPYFVMEYVPGRSITEYCDERRLGVEERLELFLRVCDGVQHAHLNAVIHRDLKPSNILITIEGGAPTPKIIDFGVAKALGDEARPAGLTQSGQIVGTAEYMSPEQAALDARPVDTRTDVYSLGVVLYELLVGSRPFERSTGRDDSFVDLCRRIRNDEPERPSVRAPGGILSRRLRGDLDAIVLKALAKEPGARYAGPSELAADIDRHLSHRVVMARPPSLAVRWRKTWRRHRVALTLSAALIALSILGGAQALRAHQTSVRNEAVSDFVVQLLDPRQPVVAGGPSVALLPRPDRNALIRLIRDKLADQPELAAKVQVAAGIDAMNTTGKSESLREARDLTRSQQGADSRAAIEADEKLARVLADSNANAEAEEIMRSALSRRIRLDGPDHLETWRSVVRMAYVLKSAHKHQQAAEQFEAAIAHMKPRLGPDDPDVVSSIVGLSGSYLELGRYRDTQILLEGALASISRVPDERQFQSAVALYNLACANARLGDNEKALEYLRASFATGFDRPGGAFADLHLFSLHGDPRFEELDRAGRLNQPTVWYRHLFHAEDLVEQGRCAEAEPMLRELIAARDRIDEESFRSRTGGARVALIHCWIRRGRYDDAEKELLPMIPGNERHGWPAFDLLAQCELGRGRRESALAYLAKAADAMEPDNERVHVVYLEAQREALAGHDRSALERLTSASDLGFDDFDRLENDLAFQNLRSRPEFRAIAKAARARAL